VRRWACDATIIPAVLNSCGEVVDLGHAQRLFTPAQIKRLWLRDQHCTYPRCDAPATWTDAHHLIHWADGGSSDLTNPAQRESPLAPRVTYEDVVGPERHIHW
jgi:hypothetical protein